MAIREYDTYGVTVSTYDLPPDQDETAYLNDVEATLRRIAGTTTGTAILFKIKSHGKALIVPYTREFALKNTHGSRCNAASFMLPDQSDSDRVGQVAFTPAIYGAKSSCSSTPGSAADVVLLHELVHTGRKLGLDAKNVKLTGTLSGYDNEEEYFAILIANIYISETKREGTLHLRSDHKTGVLQHPYDEPEVFLSVPDNFDLVDKYCQQHSTIAPMIGNADAYFNPIKTYYDWGQEYTKAVIIHPDSD